MTSLQVSTAMKVGLYRDQQGRAQRRLHDHRAARGVVLAVLSWLAAQHAAWAGETSVRSRVDVEGMLSHTTISPAPNPPVQFANLAGGGAVHGRLYVQRVRDDGSSPSLQSFLQRATSVYFGISGDGFGSRYSSAGQTLTSRTYAGTATYLGAAVYAGRLAYFGARLGFAYTYLRDADGDPPREVRETRTRFLPLMAEGGVRVDDTLISLSYAVPVRFDASGRASLPSWGITALNLRTVLERSIDLTWSAWLLTEGAGISGDVGHYLSPKLGFLASAYYRYGRLYLDDRERRHDGGGSLGLIYWFANRVGTSLQGSAHWTSGNTQTIEIAATAALSLRL